LRYTLDCSAGLSGVKSTRRRRILQDRRFGGVVYLGEGKEYELYFGKYPLGSIREPWVPSLVRFSGYGDDWSSAVIEELAHGFKSTEPSGETHPSRRAASYAAWQREGYT
jgi:hypothetical protein